MVEIGTLNRRFDFQSPTRTANSLGEIIITWSSRGKRWGALRSGPGRDRQNADQISTEVTHNIIIRKDTELPVKADWRAVSNSRTFDIRDVIDIDDRSQFWSIEAVEVPAL